jgi:transposase
MEHVVIGVDPHKLSATIEVVDQRELRLGSGRFTTDRAGFTAMRAYAKSWPDRTWAMEGANGVGRPLAQRLLAAGEHVAVPARSDGTGAAGSPRVCWQQSRCTWPRLSHSQHRKRR